MSISRAQPQEGALKRALFLIIVIAIMIAGGFLSATISRQGVGAIPGMRIQTDNPEASTLQVTSVKGGQFFIFAAVALGSVVGMGATLALIFWFLNRQVVQVRHEPNTGFEFSLNAAQPNSIGGVLTRRPAVTIFLVIVVVVSLALGFFLVANPFK
jgi:hypothetical protein